MQEGAKMKGAGMTAEGKKMPPKLAAGEDSERMNLVYFPSWLRKIDAWRRMQPDNPNRSESIRRLVEMGLDSAKKSGKHG
jgi:hypothetical protein